MKPVPPWWSEVDSEWWTRVYARLLIVSRRYSLDSESSQDAAQESLLWLLSRREPPEHLTMSYVAAVGANYARRVRRETHRRRLREVVAPADLETAETSTGNLLRIEEKIATADFIRHLPALQARVLQKMLFDGSTWSKAAASAGIPDGSRSSVRRVVRRRMTDAIVSKVR
jgi:DNA-directed RNA polymerase specialized sigma24 family protein